MHFYITGDTHRSFDRIEDFCYEYETTTEWYAVHYHVECEEGGDVYKRQQKNKEKRIIPGQLIRTEAALSDSS